MFVPDSTVPAGQETSLKVGDFRGGFSAVFSVMWQIQNRRDPWPVKCRITPIHKPHLAVIHSERLVKRSHLSQKP